MVKKRAAKKSKTNKVTTRSSPGRPKRVFTDEEKASIDQMALDNCHIDTIALALDIPKETLVRRFGTFIAQKRAEGRTLLRRAQRIKALTSCDTGMLCFLGKNELGQTDKQTQVHEISKETATLLGLIDGETKGKLPNRDEVVS